MFLRPKKNFFKFLTLFSLFILSFAAEISAQTRKPAAKKPAQIVKKSDPKKESAKPTQNSADAKRKQAEKAADAKRADEARRHAEAAHQQVFAEQRQRREQAVREVQARKAAFERGLRTQTVENIANDNTEGEDLQIRRAAVNALGGKAGMVVVMEAQTGRILTIVNQDWAVRQSYRPCSTIKLVTGVAGLNENIINSEGYSGSVRMNLDDALAFSNNAYFQNVGVHLGNTKVIGYARALGLGEPTGINMDGEAAGKLPYNNNTRLIYSHGDGYELTPLQLAVLASEITNGGKTVVPQIPRTRVEQANFQGFLRREVNVPINKLTGVIPGMIGAAEYGTAHRGVDASMGIAGKTGSCIDKGSWLGLFTSVAPVENPKYAVVVITRGQSERGKYAAAVAGQIYQALRPRLLEGSRNAALTPYNQVKPHSKVDKKTAARIDGGEDEGETDALINEDGTLSEDRSAESVGQKSVSKNPKPLPKPSGKKGEDLYAPVVIKVKKSNGEFARPRVVVTDN